MRIVTLLPSATEIVCALGLADQLVGVSHECDFPPEIVGRPVLTRPKIDPRRSSGEIDVAVRELVEQGLSVYRIETEVLRSLQPDLIITQDHCEVCAVSYRDVVAATQAVLGAKAEVVSLRPTRLEDIFDDFQRVAAAAACPERGELLVAQSRQRLAAISDSLRRARSRPRVACIEWLEPLMLAGNWVPELIELAGGICDGVTAGAHSTTITWEQLTDSAPDAVIIGPCGFKLGQTRAELGSLTSQPRWNQLPAVRNQRVYAIDGNAYLNRPGPRIIDTAELLAGLIQPGFYAHKIPPDSYERV